MPDELANGQGDHSFPIDHGRLVIRIPYRLFKGRTAVPEPLEERRFRKLLRSRYPWLTENALDVIMETAVKTRAAQIHDGQSAPKRARDLMERGELERALGLLDQHLEGCPRDAEALYAKGEALCRLGRRDEGYRCISAARRLTQDLGDLEGR